MSEDPNQALAQDVHLLGDLLAKVLSNQVGPDFLELLESLRIFSKKGDAGDLRALDQLLKSLSVLSPHKLVELAQAVSIFLNCSNLAEQNHRVRRLRFYENQEPENPQAGSLRALFEVLKLKFSKEQIYNSILNLDIELVLTAHPTEVMRYTLMKKYDHLSSLLIKKDQENLTASAQRQLLEDLERELTAIWQSDALRKQKPSPLHEAKLGFAVLESALWEGLPAFYRELNSLLQEYTGKSLDLRASPIRFASWIAGDRDGNPNVNAKISFEAIKMAKEKAKSLLLIELHALSVDLSMKEASDTIIKQIPSCEMRDVSLGPYHAYLELLIAKLEADRFNMKEELLGPLISIYHSLEEHKGSLIAQGRLIDCIRRVQCFGLYLFKVDFRQEASLHRQLLAAMVKASSGEDLESLSPEARFSFVSQALQNKISYTLPEDLSPILLEVWESIALLGKVPRESIGVYLISQSSEAADILIVEYLQWRAGIRDRVEVAPLFESRKDLEAAGDIIQTLFSDEAYLQRSNYKQQIMLGYSDSAKDAGILAANWALFEAQEKLSKLARQAKVCLCLFHGRGGSIGRGGAPTHLAILSQPKDSVAGRIRVTQQGEVIRQKYACPALAKRTLALYVSAVVQATLIPPKEPDSTMRQNMQLLADKSAAHYRARVHESPAMLDYFEAVTPIRELSELSLGSRPAKRSQVRQISQLRAIPWGFAWTQNRLLLSAWLGVGPALAAMPLADLQQMVKEWPYFGSFLSLIEMVLAKADPGISALYEEVLFPKGDKILGEALRAEYAACAKKLEEVLGISHLLEKQSVLSRSMILRNPYVLILNLLEIELLKRSRAVPEDLVIKEALRVTMVGIAAGMRNTG